ncbi:hypothetical protein B0T24DRAFT_683486 [Lasiosphaeria ovina]|uniref:Uncharacterized protein n=1 Tax=Lasiosphaeria ovina TaxID=92902 RepID=A0AAE0JW68_9PEZI|nr:hypothetical protein B0T24DRAFT_683486 [Lasiosphaeria ovina]
MSSSSMSMAPGSTMFNTSPFMGSTRVAITAAPRKVAAVAAAGGATTGAGGGTGRQDGWCRHRGSKSKTFYNSVRDDGRAGAERALGFLRALLLLAQAAAGVVP